MSLASLTMIGLLIVAGEPDASTLVDRLGSARFADREEAARLLIEQGQLAIPALRKAQDSKDLEIRARAATLLEKIESEILVRPTMVRLDFEDAPIAEVVRAIADRSRIHLALQPEANPLWKDLRVTLSEPRPVRFWEAVDRLDQAAGLQSIPSDGAPGRRPGLTLSLGTGWIPGPKSDSGPFRTYLTNIRYSLDLNLGAPAGQPRMPFGQVPPAPAPKGVVAPRIFRGGTNEQFDAMIQIQAEPRMGLATNGPIKLIEALDDKNQSLVPANPGPGANRFNGGFAIQSYSNSSIISTAVSLKRPDQPGQTIRSLKGTVPVVASTRKEGPTVVVLADAKGKAVRAGDLSITVVDVRLDPVNHRQQIEVVLRRDATGGNGPAPAIAFLTSTQLEIVDAQDRPFPIWLPQASHSTPEETRMTLNILPHEGVGPPAKLRYYELVRASAEVAFDFRNLELRMP